MTLIDLFIVPSLFSFFVFHLLYLFPTIFLVSSSSFLSSCSFHFFCLFRLFFFEFFDIFSVPATLFFFGRTLCIFVQKHGITKTRNLSVIILISILLKAISESKKYVCKIDILRKIYLKNENSSFLKSMVDKMKCNNTFICLLLPPFSSILSYTVISISGRRILSAQQKEDSAEVKISKYLKNILCRIFKIVNSKIVKIESVKMKIEKKWKNKNICRPEVDKFFCFCFLFSLIIHNVKI